MPQDKGKGGEVGHKIRERGEVGGCGRQKVAHSWVTGGGGGGGGTNWHNSFSKEKKRLELIVI